MTGLIKHDRAGPAIDRLPVTLARPSDPSPYDPRLSELEARVAELERALDAERRLAAEALKAERRKSDQASAAAYKEGRDQAALDDGQRIRLLEQGIADAVAAWRDHLTATDGLAATLAAAALDKMFGDASDMAALVARTLGHHLERLERRAVLSIGVSAIDFPDDVAATRLAAQVGVAPVSVVVRPELPAGACRIALRLGEVELDPTAQWAVLERALRTMGEAA